MSWQADLHNSCGVTTSWSAQPGFCLVPGQEWNPRKQLQLRLSLSVSEGLSLPGVHRSPASGLIKVFDERAKGGEQATHAVNLSVDQRNTEI